MEKTKKELVHISEDENSIKEIAIVLALGVVANIITFYLIKKHLIK